MIYTDPKEQQKLDWYKFFMGTVSVRPCVLYHITKYSSSSYDTSFFMPTSRNKIRIYVASRRTVATICLDRTKVLKKHSNMDAANPVEGTGGCRLLPQSPSTSSIIRLLKYYA
uniref:Uncharacterized protein n=1 Tax=Sphaerodactylus townsendi TaxID=933632 RepID=A0ACB8E6V9_9SAUR